MNNIKIARVTIANNFFFLLFKFDGDNAVFFFATSRNPLLFGLLAFVVSL